MTIVDQLNEFYTQEYWHKIRLNEKDITDYHERLLSLGNIITVSDGDILCGYVELWRVTFEQFGRIICGESFSAFLEDVQSGQVGYCANTYIRPEYRNGTVYKILRNRFFEATRDCTYLVGEARRKKSSPVKVFRRENIMSLNKELQHGFN